MSTKPEPRNSGAGMREVQRIQDERLAKPTCGDCKHCEVRTDCYDDKSMHCICPRPACDDVPEIEISIEAWAAMCECFKRKDAK